MHIHRLIQTTLASTLIASNVASAGAADKIFQETNGAVVVEAENFSSRTGTDAQWLIIPTEDPGPETFANARGGQYIQALPNAGVNNNATATWTNQPWADYLVLIRTPGTY